MNRKCYGALLLFIFLSFVIIQGIFREPVILKGLGEEAASYALEFVGNPYLYGGESLTEGADCSGFIKAVYGHFGVETVRTSSEFREFGKKVCTGFDDKLAKPGDIICYEGHVALYIGNGKIVHASNPKDGIKISCAKYQKALCVRRIENFILAEKD